MPTETIIATPLYRVDVIYPNNETRTAYYDNIADADLTASICASYDGVSCVAVQYPPEGRYDYRTPALWDDDTVRFESWASPLALCDIPGCQCWDLFVDPTDALVCLPQRGKTPTGGHCSDFDPSQLRR